MNGTQIESIVFRDKISQLCRAIYSIIADGDYGRTSIVISHNGILW